MKLRIVTFVAVMFKILWSIISILILAHAVFIILVLFNFKIPAIAKTKFVDYPVKVYLTEARSHYRKKSPDGAFKEVVNYPFNFNLHNIKDTTDVIQVTSVVSGNLTLDVNNKREILLVIFIKRLVFLIIFFILFFQLDKVYSSFRKKEPFNQLNVKRLKIIAYSIMSLSPVILLFNNLTIHIFKSYKILGYGTMITHSLNPQYIFFGLLILIIAFAFEVGSELKKESEFTI